MIAAVLAIWVLSPWLNHGPVTQPTTTIVLHATAGDEVSTWQASGAIRTLRVRHLSYHYIIAKNGLIVKCVPSYSTAFHAGVSVGPEGGHVNNYSIGVAFINRNDGVDSYTPAQYQSLEHLVARLRPAFSQLKWVTTHAIISPGRKSDPKGFHLGWEAPRLHLWVWRPKNPVLRWPHF